MQNRKKKLIKNGKGKNRILSCWEKENVTWGIGKKIKKKKL